MRDRVDIQIIPSAGANVQILKEDWVDWIRVELFYYLLGQGCDVNYERATSPGPEVKDIVGSMSSWRWKGTPKAPIFFSQVDGSAGALPYELDETAERLAADWYRCTHRDEDIRPESPEYDDSWMRDD